jgi:hypothetical protein
MSARFADSSLLTGSQEAASAAKPCKSTSGSPLPQVS